MSAARPAAVAFVRSYVAYLYGQITPGRVTGLDQSLRQQLQAEQAAPTPAEQAAHPRLAPISLSARRASVGVTASAIVSVGRAAPLRLTATLEPHGRTWLVVGIDA